MDWENTEGGREGGSVQTCWCTTKVAESLTVKKTGKRAGSHTHRCQLLVIYHQNLVGYWPRMGGKVGSILADRPLSSEDTWAYFEVLILNRGNYGY